MYECHLHMVLDGRDWKQAIARHKPRPDPEILGRTLAQYRDRGFTYLRDGGDKWGVGLLARELAPTYGLTYRTPLAPLCLAGHYGSFIGETFQDLAQYRALVQTRRAQGADFIKIIISGLMDFDRFGILTQPGLEPALIRDMVAIAHDAGFPVMAHCNGGETIVAAARAGVDSIEHGAYASPASLNALGENQVIWVPTLSAIGNLRGTGRHPDYTVARILDSSLQAVAEFAAQGGVIAPGSDAGAWAVPHAGTTEYQLLGQVLTPGQIRSGGEALAKRFS